MEEVKKIATAIRQALVDIGWPLYAVLKFFGRCLIGLILLSKKIAWGYLIVSIILIGISAAGIWLHREILQSLPNVNQIYDPPKMTSKILARDGSLLYKFYTDENRTWTPLSKIPQNLIWATIAIEDKEFYQHHGISLRGTLKALWYNLAKREDQDGLRGGSTITQQLVKNVYFTGEKVLSRKIKEAILAIIIEFKLNKQEILERYFNQVPYGGETYGAQEASLKYFGKNVWEIDLNEASFLAGLPASPSSYSPYGQNPEFAYARQRHVVDEMVSAGFITKAQGEEVKQNKKDILKERKNITAPHFVFYVKDYAETKFNITAIERQGLTIITSLDRGIQQNAENIVADELKKVSRLHITNGASMVIDVKSGDVLAMVGSKDYYATDIDGKFNVTTALRQPGSSIKPINYLLALRKGMSMSSTIDDSPITYVIPGSKPYSPKNYNGNYLGRVTLKTALASSLNIPSVKLLQKNGVDNMIDLAEKMGITSWTDRSRFGLALSLGSGEVKMTELAGAYTIFANLGKKIDVNPILKIENYLGETVYNKSIEINEVVEPKYAFMINNTLSDNQARSPVFGLNSKLVIPGHTVAVKTGTTNSLKDNWCIGWTPTYLVATWVGNNDSSPMSWVASGISGATPIWYRMMKDLLAGKNDEPWEPPAGVYRAKACGREDFFSDGVEKTIKCLPSVTPTPADGSAPPPPAP